MRIDERRFLICFGCQRGGTTWLDDQLRKHPGFDFPPRKELRYLDPIYVHKFESIQQKRLTRFRRRLHELLGPKPELKSSEQARILRWDAKYSIVTRNEYTDDWYQSLFDECDPELVTGDFSPDYSLLPDEGVAHLARLVPNARLIFVMRDPVDRLISGTTYAIRKLSGLSEESVINRLMAIARGPMQFNFSDYRSIIERYERFFAPEQIMVLFHDQIKEAPHSLIEQVCSHIGTDFNANWFPSPISKSINRSPTLQIPEGMVKMAVEKLEDNLLWAADRFGGSAENWKNTYL
jgi:hypothetical protein